MKLKYYLRGLGLGVIFSAIILAVAYSTHGSDISDAEVISRAEKLGMEMKEEGGGRLSNKEILASEMSRETENSGTEAKETEKNAQNSQKTDTQAQDSQKTETTSEKNGQGDSSQTSSEKSSQAAGSSQTASGNDAKTEQKSSEKSSQATNPAQSASTDDTKTEQKSSQKAGSSEKKESSSQTKTPKKEKDTSTKNVKIIVGDGDGCRQVAEQLKEKGLITDTEDFRNYMSGRGLDSSIMNGTFTIPKGATYREISLILTNK